MQIPRCHHLLSCGSVAMADQSLDIFTPAEIPAPPTMLQCHESAMPLIYQVVIKGEKSRAEPNVPA